MNSPFAIIGIAWSFYRKQPVLNLIAFWLFFFPVALLDTMTGIVSTVSAQGVITIDEMKSMSTMEIAITIPVAIVLIYLMVWGQACTLIIAKKMINSSAGRARSSFKAVRNQAKKYIIPLFFVGILRSATTLLWMLLLIIPGVIYAVRTAFFDIMMIDSGKVVYGRTVLTKSTDLVKGHTGEIFWRLIAIGACIFIPASIATLSIEFGLTRIDERLIDLAVILGDGIEAYTGMFFIVCTVALYAELKKLQIKTVTKK